MFHWCSCYSGAKQTNTGGAPVGVEALPARSDTSLSDDKPLPRNQDGSIDYDGTYRCISVIIL